MLEETDDGLLCVECGWAGRHLGLHAFRAHGLSADQYRARHGLRRGVGLVVSTTRVRIQDSGTTDYEAAVCWSIAAWRRSEMNLSRSIVAAW